MINLLRKKLTRECKENVAHSLWWLLVFFLPIITMFFHSNGGAEEYNWAHVFSTWTVVSIYFGAFLIHNFLLLPLIIYRRQPKCYVCGTVVLMFVFVLVQYVIRTRMVQDTSRVLIQTGHIQSGTIHYQPTIVTQPIIVNIIILVLMFGMNFGVKLFFKTNEDQKKLHDLCTFQIEVQ